MDAATSLVNSGHSSVRPPFVLLSGPIRVFARPLYYVKYPSACGEGREELEEGLPNERKGVRIWDIGALHLCPTLKWSAIR